MWEYVFLIISLYLMPASASIEAPGHVKEFVQSHMKGYGFYSGKLNDWAEVTRQFYIEHSDSSTYYESHTTENPWSVAIDFNGDGQKDWVGFLINVNDTTYSPKKLIGLYCVCTRDGTFTSIVIRRPRWIDDSEGVIFGVHPAEPGLYHSQIDGQESTGIPFEGVEYMNYEKSTRVYYLDENMIKEFWTSD